MESREWREEKEKGEREKGTYVNSGIFKGLVQVVSGRDIFCEQL